MTEDASIRPAFRPDPVVPHPAWQEAFARLRAAAGQGACVALLGLPGTGKTLLLRTLSRSLEADGIPATVLAHGAEAGAKMGSAGLILVDEADRCDDESLDALAATGRGLVLAALPGFAPRLARWPGAVTVALRPLSPTEAAEYLWAHAGHMGAADRLTDDAVAALVEQGAGLPRLLNALLTAADFVASLQDAPNVTATHVAEAVALRGEVDAAAAVEPAGPAGEPIAAEQTPPAIETPSPPPAIERVPEPARVPVAERLSPERVSLARSSAEPAPARRGAVFWAILALLALAALVAAGLLLRTMVGRHPLPKIIDPVAPTVPAAAPPQPPPPPQHAVPTPAPAPAPAPPAIPAPAAPAPPGPAALLPAGLAPHVVVVYPLHDVRAERRGRALARTLHDAGITANDPVPIPHRVRYPGILYFFADDAAGAASVARVVGDEVGPLRAERLRPNAVLPRPGTIELLLSTAPPRPAPPSVTAPAPGAALPAARLVMPADNAILPTGDPQVTLTWTAPDQASGLRYYVEVLALTPNPPREAFSGYTHQTQLPLRLSAAPRSYAWRVLTVGGVPLRYSPSPWRSFSTGGTAP